MCDLSVCWSAVRARDRCCCCCWPTVNSRQKSWSSEAEWKLKLKLWLLLLGRRLSRFCRCLDRLLQTSSMSCQWSRGRRRRRKKTLATTVINSEELNWTELDTEFACVPVCVCVFTFATHYYFRLLHTHFRPLKSSADWLISRLNLLQFVFVFTL